MPDPNDLGTMENATNPAYQAHMAQTVAKGKCPLCDPLGDMNKVLKQNAYWRIWKNPFGYAHHEYHLVIAANSHVDSITELSPIMWQKLGEIVQWAVREFGLEGGGLVMRFGDPKLSASSLRHLHMHIQVPDGTGPAFAVFDKTGFKDVVGD